MSGDPTAIWFSDKPDPIACTPLPACLICGRPANKTTQQSATWLAEEEQQ